jgi:hypothetical protein
MRYLSSLLLLGLISTNPSYASVHEHKNHKLSDFNTIQVVVVNPPDKITPNTTEILRMQLLKDNQPISLNDLKTVHTKKIHLMVIDSTLTDYYHTHPLADSKNKDFVFNFTPKKSGPYQIWVEFTPSATNKQVFIKIDMGHSSQKPLVNKEEKLNTHVGPYQFDLKLDGKAQVGQPVMATITVTKDGKPVDQLEPVMGAFAHVVGFNADYSSIMHIHPMGKEPSNDSERGGSKLMFHLEPQNAGYVKLFAQFRINGTDIYVPFGIFVN